MSVFVAAAMMGYQVISGLNQADAIHRTGRMNKMINDMNAELTEIDALNALNDGMSYAARYSSQADAVISSQNALFASRGQDVSFGTAADIQADSRLNKELNILDIANAARFKAKGYVNEAAQQRVQGAMGISASNASANATTGASVIKGASNFAGPLSEYLNSPSTNVKDDVTGGYSEGRQAGY